MRPVPVRPGDPAWGAAPGFSVQAQTMRKRVDSASSERGIARE
jgi:hypothetical protein